MIQINADASAVWQGKPRDRKPAMPRRAGHDPTDKAPASGRYELLNIFGTSTDESVTVSEGPLIRQYRRLKRGGAAMRAMARSLAAALLALVLPTCAEAQLVIRQAVMDIDVRPDGSMLQTAHIAMRATNDAAAQRIAQRPIVFSASREELTIVEAYTQKQDGRKLPVDAGAIHAQLVPGSPSQRPGTEGDSVSLRGRAGHAGIYNAPGGE
jgi:Domain of Unknown Function with PDB structure (DUF3857)